MKIYEKPSLAIESLLSGVAVANYADPNDFPIDSDNGPEHMLSSQDFWGDILKSGTD